MATKLTTRFILLLALFGALSLQAQTVANGVVFISADMVRNPDAVIGHAPAAKADKSPATIGGGMMLPQGCAPVAVSFLKRYVARNPNGLAIVLNFDPEPANPDSPLHVLAIYEERGSMWFNDQDLGQIDLGLRPEVLTTRLLISTVRTKYLAERNARIESGSAHRDRETASAKDAFYAVRPLGQAFEFKAKEAKARGVAYAYAGQVWLYIPEAGIGSLAVTGESVTTETVTRALSLYFHGIQNVSLKG